MPGFRRPHHIIVALLLAGCSGESTTPQPTTSLQRFDAYWAAFDTLYPSFPAKGVDWRALRDTYRPQAARIGSTVALVEVLRSMVTPLNDGHIRFVAPDGQTLTSWTPRGVANWDRAQWLASWPALGYTQVKPNLGYAMLTGGIGYVVFGGWNATHFSVADADAVLDRFAGAQGLIIDVRMNGGGDDRLALAVAGRFLSGQRTAGTVRYRSGRSYDALGDPVPITVGARAPRIAVPVLLLTGRGVYSSTEEFVDAMRQEVNVTTFGDTTGGSSGNPAQRSLGDGWQFTVPRWQHRASDGRLIEDHGIAPEIVSPWDAAAARAGRDPVLDSAVAYLRRRP